MNRRRRNNTNQPRAQRRSTQVVPDFTSTLDFPDLSRKTPERDSREVKQAKRAMTKVERRLRRAKENGMIMEGMLRFVDSVANILDETREEVDPFLEESCDVGACALSDTELRSITIPNPVPGDPPINMGVLPIYGNCSYCGFYGYLTFDHIIPICRSGIATTFACPECNVKKGNTALRDWANSMPVDSDHRMIIEQFLAAYPDIDETGQKECARIKRAT
jgi:5-methylcytosine-specific restriction endonuclease McrA